MPNPATSLTFTPDTDGNIVCTSNYSVQQFGTSSDWGGSDPGTVMQVTRVSDNAVLHTGPFMACSRTRLPQTYKTAFPVLLSDGAITVNVNSTGGGPATSITHWDVDLIVEFVKR